MQKTQRGTPSRGCSKPLRLGPRSPCSSRAGEGTGPARGWPRGHGECNMLPAPTSVGVTGTSSCISWPTAQGTGHQVALNSDTSVLRWCLVTVKGNLQLKAVAELPAYYEFAVLLVTAGITGFNSFPPQKQFTLLSHHSSVLVRIKRCSSYWISGCEERDPGDGPPLDRPTCLALIWFETFQSQYHYEEMYLIFPERKSPKDKVICLFLTAYVRQRQTWWVIVASQNKPARYHLGKTGSYCLGRLTASGHSCLGSWALMKSFLMTVSK